MPMPWTVRARRSLRARACAGVVAAAIAVLGLQATSAAAAPSGTAATQPSHPSSHLSSHPGPNGRFGFSWARPTGSTPPPATPNDTSTPYTHTPAPGSENDLPRGTGPVMHGLTISMVFWLPAGRHFESDTTADAAYENLQQRWAKDVGGTPFYNLLTQYYDDTGHIPNSASFGGAWVDTRAYPHAGTTTDPLPQSDITDEVAHAVATNGWTEDATHIIAVFTGRDVQECMDVSRSDGCSFTDGGVHTQAFCAYHSHFSDSGRDTLYAFMADDDGFHGNGIGCDVSGTTPNGDKAADSEVSTLSHEIIESVTDPHPNQSWTDPTKDTGGEIGDKCAYNFTPRNDAGADVYLHGHPYILQQEWSNAVHTCAIDYCVISGTGGVCPPQPTAAESVDNPNPVVGSTVTYTVAVQNPDDTGAALSASVNGPLPSGYVLTGLSAPGAASQSSTASSFSVGYDTLPVHEQRTITVTATVPTQPGQSATACSTVDSQDLLSKAQPTVTSSPCGSTRPGKIPTAVTYDGPTTADYHDGFTAAASVTGQGSPVSGGAVTFTLGSAHCTATTDGSGNASCGLTPVDPAGPLTLHVDYAGDGTHEASSAASAFTVTHEETTLAYTGPKHVANGVPATLSGVLKEDGTTGIAGRSVQIALGTGSTQQTCAGTTAADGTVSCTIGSVNQPLTDAATVPVGITFAGDAYYLPSSAAATVRLEYYTGHSFGLSADVNLILTPLTIPPTPDTGPVRTAQASSTDTPCTASISTLLVSADALCANVTTKLAPGTSTATATVQDATIGIPGLPVIGISGLTATSVSTCTGTSGSATLTLTVAGAPVTVPTAPNSVIGLPGGARLVVNEQSPVAGADYGTTVNAVHLVVPGLLGGANTVDVVVGSATSDAHNCS